MQKKELYFLLAVKTFKRLGKYLKNYFIDSDSKMTEHLLKVPSGCIKGFKKTTALNSKPYYSFQGIPYAAPPTGKNRFKEPLPCKPWDGVLNATKLGNVCPQIDEFTKQFVGNEDCLFLNVYTPKVPDVTNTTPLPVMVYIHGGGFTFGSATDEIYGPDYIVERDVILVTFNYRLGVLGFLSLGNSNVPGNAGLKDQVMALKWVQENIKYFCGNSDNVTLFGESAGSASVHFHTLSPLSVGLFHKVILQSGCGFCPWSFCNNPVSRGSRLAEVLGNKTENIHNVEEFLRSQSPESLVKSQGKILTEFERKKLTFPFLPCKEVLGTGNNFITEDPIVLSESGKFAKVPYIIGMTDKEGIIMLKEETDLHKKMEKLNNDDFRFVPFDLCPDNKPDKNVVKKVRDFYFLGGSLSSETLSEYCDLCTDLEFTVAINKVHKHLVSNGVPVYTYLFSFEGELGYLKKFIKSTIKNIPNGVCHADELGYIFHNTLIFDVLPVKSDSEEVKIIDTFSTFWSNFAKNSDPNDCKYGIEWKQYTGEQQNYLDIGKSLVNVQSKLFPERVQFWENIYETEKLTHKL